MPEDENHPDDNEEDKKKQQLVLPVAPPIIAAIAEETTSKESLEINKVISSTQPPEAPKEPEKDTTYDGKFFYLGVSKEDKKVEKAYVGIEDGTPIDPRWSTKGWKGGYLDLETNPALENFKGEGDLLLYRTPLDKIDNIKLDKPKLVKPKKTLTPSVTPPKEPPKNEGISSEAEKTNIKYERESTERTMAVFGIPEQTKPQEPLDVIPTETTYTEPAEKKQEELEKIQKEHELLAKQYELLEGQLDKSHENNHELRLKIDSYKQQLLKDTSEIEDLDQQNQYAEEQLSQKTTEVEKLGSEIGKISSELREKWEYSENLEDEIGKISSELRTKTDAIDDLDKQFAYAEGQLSKAAKENEAMKSERVEMTTHIDKTTAKIKADEKYINHLESDSEEQQKNYEKVRDLLRETPEDYGEANKEFEKLKSQLETSKKETNDWKSKYDELINRYNQPTEPTPEPTEPAGEEKQPAREEPQPTEPKPTYSYSLPMTRSKIKRGGLKYRKVREEINPLTGLSVLSETHNADTERLENDLDALYQNNYHCQNSRLYIVDEKSIEKAARKAVKRQTSIWKRLFHADDFRAQVKAEVETQRQTKPIAYLQIEQVPARSAEA